MASTGLLSRHLLRVLCVVRVVELDQELLLHEVPLIALRPACAVDLSHKDKFNLLPL